MNVRTTFARLGAAALLWLPAAEVAKAQSVPFVREVKVGLVVQDMPGLWSGFQLERGVGVNGEVILAPVLPLFGGHIRPALGGTYAIAASGHRATSKAYADARWMFEAQSGLFLSLGIGAAIHDGVLGPTEIDRKALGRRILFHFPLEVGYRFDAHNSLSLYFDHISNGYTTSSNEGLDTLGVRYGYKF